MISIDKGVPIPKAEKGGSPIFPFREMQIGDSFAVPVPAGSTAERVRSRISSCAWAFAQRTPGYKFSTRAEDGGRAVRCWRVPVHSLLSVTRTVPPPAAVVGARVHVLSDEPPARLRAGGRK